MNAAIFCPRLKMPNPLKDNQMETFAACGAVAGVMARTDATRGLWKAPAGLDAVLRGVADLSVSLTDPENGELNPLGINCLRFKPTAGRIIWGASGKGTTCWPPNGNTFQYGAWHYTWKKHCIEIRSGQYRRPQYAV